MVPNGISQTTASGKAGPWKTFSLALIATALSFLGLPAWAAPSEVQFAAAHTGYADGTGLTEFAITPSGPGTLLLPPLNLRVLTAQGPPPLRVWVALSLGAELQELALVDGVAPLPFRPRAVEDLWTMRILAESRPGLQVTFEPAEPFVLTPEEALGGEAGRFFHVTNWWETGRFLASCTDAAGMPIPLSDSGDLDLGVLQPGFDVSFVVVLAPGTAYPVTLTVTDERGYSAFQILSRRAEYAVNPPPIAWPSETIGWNGWTEYTARGVVVKDRHTDEGDCSNGGTSPQGETDICRGAVPINTPPYYASALYAFDTANRVFFYRIRVAALPLVSGANSAYDNGFYTDDNPFTAVTWNLLVDTDGDGYKEFNVVLAGDSGGGNNRDINPAGYLSGNSGDDLKIYYNNLNSQCVTPETIKSNAVETANDLVWWGNAGTKNATVPPVKTADGAAWDFGRTRMVYHTSANATWGEGYFVDFQFPVPALTDAWNGGTGGRVLIGPNTPISFGYSTSNSNSNPLQKDYAYSDCYIAGCDNRFPYVDIVTLPGGTTQYPVIGPLTISGITCPTQATVSAYVVDSLQVVPPSGGGTVTDTIASVTFQYYYDANGNGLEDDGSSWTNMAVVAPSLNPDTNGNLAPNGTTASFNDWGVVWNTAALANGQYLIKVTAADEDASPHTTARVVGSYIISPPTSCRQGVVGSWESYSDSFHLMRSDTFLNNPGSTAYMLGAFTPSTNYKVAFYDSAGALISIVSTNTDTFGFLEASLAVTPASPTGTYHSVVYPPIFTPPGTYNGVYNSATNPIIGDDSFVVSSNPAVQTPPPTVNSPIYAGATTVSGTSTSPAGTLIDVYADGKYLGQTTVQAGGTWTLTGILHPLLDGQAITATATDLANGMATSVPSPPVYVGANAGNISDPPVITSPVVAGATLVSGTSTEGNGTIIDVYANGVYLGQATVTGGAWTLSGLSALTAETVLTATATNLPAGEGTSGPSAPVTVRHLAPVVTGPINAGATSISGTSTSPVGTTITVYMYGSSVGTTTVQAGGTWTLNGVSGLTGGQIIRAKAGTGAGESDFSNTVVVTPAAPVVAGPIVAGATSVSGTSTAPVGSTITVYKNGASIGTTVVLADGTWTLSGISPALDAGNVIKATVTAGGQTSADSNLVTVIVDSDNDGIPDATDLDDDNDGILDTVEGSGTVDTDGDGVPDSLDRDSDNDGINDLVESGLNAAEIALVDTNGDGRIDTPVGTNGLADMIETAVDSGLPDYNNDASGPDTVADTDGDGKPDFRDLDSDNDGINDVIEGGEADTDENGMIDGTPHPVTGQIPGSDNVVPDTDSDGTPDFRDLDSDGDGVKDIVESGQGGLDGDGDGDVDDPTDTDGDGIPDIIDENEGPFGDGVVKPQLLRNDQVAALESGLSAVFSKTYPLPVGQTSMDVYGADVLATFGEGALTGSLGSSDDDDLYKKNVVSPYTDPDTTVLSDDTRPLVFYELTCTSCTIYVNKAGGEIQITW